MKQTLITENNKTIKINEGDLVMAIQAIRDEENHLSVNMDWLFDKKVKAEEIKSMLGSFLHSVSDVWGEKMVTEAIEHYARETNNIINTEQGQFAWLKSKDKQFKNLTKEGGKNNG